MHLVIGQVGDIVVGRENLRLERRDVALHQKGRAGGAVGELRDDLLPLLLRLEAARVHVGRAVGVGGLDDPGVLVGADGVQVDFLLVEVTRLRDGALHERDLLGRQKRLCGRVEQRLEDLLVVHDVAGEAADERHLLCLDGFDERLRFVPELQHVVGDAAAPDGVDGLAFLVAQHFAVEGQVAHVAHRAGVPGLGEALCEQVELVDHAVLQIVAYGEAGVVHAMLVGGVDGGELAHPRVEQLAAFHVMTARELLEGGRFLHRMRDLAVLVHARAAVAVELAKRHVAGVLVQEDVEAGEGQQRIVAARDQDQLG